MRIICLVVFVFLTSCSTKKVSINQPNTVTLPLANSQPSSSARETLRKVCSPGFKVEFVTNNKEEREHLDQSYKFRCLKALEDIGEIEIIYLWKEEDNSPTVRSEAHRILTNLCQCSAKK